MNQHLICNDKITTHGCNTSSMYFIPHFLSVFLAPSIQNSALWPPIFHCDPKICQTGLISINKGSHEHHLENSMKSLLSYPQLMKLKADVQHYITCTVLLHCKTHQNKTTKASTTIYSQHLLINDNLYQANVFIKNLSKFTSKMLCPK